MDDYFDPESWLRNRPTLMETKNHPNHWMSRAESLKASAGAVWYGMDHGKAVAKELGYHEWFSMDTTYPVYHMLCGLSLELIMKAVIVQRQPKRKFKSHDLGHLHTALGLPIDEARKNLLNFYKQAIVWSGRYPVPKDEKNQELESCYQLEVDALTTAKPIVPGSPMLFRWGNGATNWEPFCELYEEYAALFRYPLPTPSPLPPPAPT